MCESLCASRVYFLEPNLYVYNFYYVNFDNKVSIFNMYEQQTSNNLEINGFSKKVHQKRLFR